MNSLSRVIHFIFFVLVTSIVFCQTETQNAKIVLKSGVIISGKVFHIDYQNQVDVIVGDSDTLKIKWEDISQLDFLTNTTKVPIPKNYVHKTLKQDELYNDTAYYFYSSASIPLGLDYYGDPVAGFSLLVGAGKSFGYRHHVGIRSGYEFYLWPDINVIPIGLDYYGRLKPQGKSLYYGLGIGYAFPNVAAYRWYNNYSVKGGVYLNPYFGITRKRNLKRSWNIEFGYKSQVMFTAYDGYIYQMNQQTPSRIEEKIRYQRFEIRFGFHWD